MKQKLKYLVFFFIVSYTNAQMHQAVTYELSPGRFGDNLLSFIHAKWISYKYQLPLLYKPFVYSDRLTMHYLEHRYDENKNKFKQVRVLGNNVFIDQKSTLSQLYVVPYFPESKYELEHGISFAGGRWYHFDVDWKDQQFIKELTKVITSYQEIAKMQLPSDCITVALHIRRGGNFDASDTIAAFPMKFLSNEFYINQLKKLYFFLNERPLYVYLFTDDNNPKLLLQMFENNFKELKIQFECREKSNSDTTNVIEDFFAMQQFDCLIHSESNYSFIASKLGNYLVSIYPDAFHKENNRIIYTNINFSLNSEKYNLLTRS